jgi:hypothetical protein
MKISFDIDDTLILYDRTAGRGPRLLNGERLRPGAVELLRDLQARHELYLYTTSYRSPWLMRLCFRLRGIRIARVINQTEHEGLRTQLSLFPFPSKYPPHFRIHLHIDDSEGVAREGERYGFRVLQLDPSDKNWATTVRNYIADLEKDRERGGG